jgi:prolyl-tRNA editing enzyme YbaK/EbsC (Cys-tRNA(Pro) deacylase)
MGIFTLGSLTTVAAAERPDLLGPTVLAELERLGLLDAVGVVGIDAVMSDTASTREHYGLDLHTLANCVVVSGKRDGVEKMAACLIPATTRADVNGIVRHELDVRKASFLSQDRAVELTGMEPGGITPIGLPEDWPVFVDDAVINTGLVMIGSGVRRSKLIVRGADLVAFPAVRVIAGLGKGD